MRPTRHFFFFLRFWCPGGALVARAEAEASGVADAVGAASGTTIAMASLSLSAGAAEVAAALATGGVASLLLPLATKLATPMPTESAAVTNTNGMARRPLPGREILNVGAS